MPFFRDVGVRQLGMDVPMLAGWLLSELKRAGAIAIEGDAIVPTMAA